MLPKRKLVCDFLDLPTHVQFAIAKELGLATPEIQADNTEAYREWFRECYLSGRLDKLRELVDREMP